MSNFCMPNTEWLVNQACAFINSPANDLNMTRPEPAFGAPLCGVSSGADPIWEQLKDESVIGPYHWAPLEAYKLAYPKGDAVAGELAVFTWVLPQTDITKQDNRKETLYPSERWARNRVFGEANVNFGLGRHLVQALHDTGVEALMPVLLPEWHMQDSATYTYASLWSERHAAYIAGLGTFGLSDGLITPVGKAMRVGSIIVRLPLKATPRQYDDYHAYCLYYQDGSCAACAARCPVGSVSTKGRDKVPCKQYTLVEVVPKYVEEHFGFTGYGCGLCQTKVPCESRIPAGIKLK